MNRIHPWVVAIWLVAGPLALGSAAAIDRMGRSAESTCQPEMHRCLEKLRSRLPVREGAPHWSKIEQSLLELQEADPECALLLRGAALPLH